MLLIGQLTVAQAATIINAIVTVIQYTLELSLVAILVALVYNIHSASSWSAMTRMLHTSLWPFLLRSDSASTENTERRLSFISRIAFVGGILTAIASIITPLGLRNGPNVPHEYFPVDASYVLDASPIGRATPPRSNQMIGRLCGLNAEKPCPGKSGDTKDAEIAPSVLKIFQSTPYGPLSIQSRQFYTDISRGSDKPLTHGKTAMFQSLIMNERILAIEGAVVDLTNQPGIGFLNHTIPNIDHPATWSQEILWVEPVTRCVNTNLTVDYKISNPSFTTGIGKFNLTDHGGFVNFRNDSSEPLISSQNVDLHKHAHRGAVLVNSWAMKSFQNLTNAQSYIGRSFASGTFNSGSLLAGKLMFLTFRDLVNGTAFSVLNDPEFRQIESRCRGYGGENLSSINRTAIYCSLVLGPPSRLDGGDPKFVGVDSEWTQNLHVCASVNRVRMQKINFTFNGTRQVENLQVSREDVRTPVLWATEKGNLTIAEFPVLWGRIADSYQNDPSLSTTRSEVFYPPASVAEWSWFSSEGLPFTVMGLAWPRGVFGSEDLWDYSGVSDLSLLSKWQSLIQEDASSSPAMILNLIWTHLAANSMVGSYSETTLLTAKTSPTTTYDLKYGIPALLLFLVWLPVFAFSLLVLATGFKISYLGYLLNQTSVGRVVVRDSALHALGHPDGATVQSEHVAAEPGISREESKTWAGSKGKSLVAFNPGVTLHGSSTEEVAEREELLSREIGQEGYLDMQMRGRDVLVVQKTSLKRSLVAFVQNEASNPPSRIWWGPKRDIDTSTSK